MIPACHGRGEGADECISHLGLPPSLPPSLPASLPACLPHGFSGICSYIVIIIHLMTYHHHHHHHDILSLHTMRGMRAETWPAAACLLLPACPQPRALSTGDGEEGTGKRKGIKLPELGEDNAANSNLHGVDEMSQQVGGIGGRGDGPAGRGGGRGRRRG